MPRVDCSERSLSSLDDRETSDETTPGYRKTEPPVGQQVGRRVEETGFSVLKELSF